MPTTFLENVALHIEDDPTWINIVTEIFEEKLIQKAYGGPIKHVKSSAGVELLQSQLEIEVNRIVYEAGRGPALVSVVTAQVARTFLERILPGVTVSDTLFPLNGKIIAKWLMAEGYPNYALIGFSSTPFEDIDPELQEWFKKSNATYLCKDCSVIQLMTQIIKSRKTNIESYRT